MPLDSVDEDFNPVHWAQAKCYAYIHALNENLDGINIRLTYCHLDTEEIKYLIKSFDFLELKQFLMNLLKNIMYGQSLSMIGRLKEMTRLKL